MLAPAPTASRICSGVAAVWPSETVTPASTHFSTNADVPGHSGESVTIRIRPPAASCHRRNASQSGAVMNALSCAPRTPSSGEMKGPSRWNAPALDAASGSVSHARARTLMQDSMTSLRFVMTVGK